MVWNLISNKHGDCTLFNLHWIYYSKLLAKSYSTIFMHGLVVSQAYCSCPAAVTFSFIYFVFINLVSIYICLVLRSISKPYDHILHEITFLKYFNWHKTVSFELMLICSSLYCFNLSLYTYNIKIYYIKCIVWEASQYSWKLDSFIKWAAGECWNFLPYYLIFFFFCFSTLPGLLQSMDLSTLKCFPPGQPEKFSAFLDKVVGLQK